jgi:hypothetical protein
MSMNLSFRYNSRNLGTRLKFNEILANTEHRVTYKELIANE